MLFGCFKRRLDAAGAAEVKVAQLAGYCAEHTAYHHGEASLHATIIGMAQDFVGTRRIALLLAKIRTCVNVLGYGPWPYGRQARTTCRYSSRSGSSAPDSKVGRTRPRPATSSPACSLTPAACSRPATTRCSPLAMTTVCPPPLPHQLGRPPGSRQFDRRPSSTAGYPIEPEHYIPVIPVVLANGAAGIGTGYSTSLPSYNPRHLVAALLHRLGAEPAAAAPPGPLTPWYDGFTGAVERQPAAESGVHYKTFGRARLMPPSGGRLKASDPAGLIEIDELPIGTWTSDYKQLLTRCAPAFSGGPRASSRPACPCCSRCCFPLIAAARGRRRRIFDDSIADIREFHTDDTVRFEVAFESLADAPESICAAAEATRLLSTKARRAAAERGQPLELGPDGLRWLRLESSLRLSNVHLFDAAGQVRSQRNWGGSSGAARALTRRLARVPVSAAPAVQRTRGRDRGAR